jgi:hypothetical protein
VTAGLGGRSVAGLRAAQRWVVAIAALAAAVAHVPVIAPHLDEAPYMGVLFVVLSVGCTAIALAALLRDSAAGAPHRRRVVSLARPPNEQFVPGTRLNTPW